MRAFLIAGLAMLLQADGAEPRILPQDQILAYRMPGTRAIEEHAKLADMRQLGSVLKSWFHRAEKLKFNDVARPGFAVPGTGVSALRAALSVFSEKGKPRETFSPDDEITIVFFSEPSSGNHVRIEQVAWEGNRVQIQYWLEPYQEGTLSQTFALIQIGKMPVAEYRVEMHQLPRDHKFIEMGYELLDKDWSRKVLCKPFTFVVAEQRE